jgi:hypothetical protein
MHPKTTLNKGVFIMQKVKKTTSIKIDLPIIAQRDGSFNVEYKNRNVYIGQHTNHHCFIALVSDDLNAPVYKGGFIELYPRDGMSLSELFEQHGLWIDDSKAGA